MSQRQQDGYLALPSTGEGRPVLVLHAWWGLTEMITNLCDQLAALGFVAYAPDLFQGQLATTIEAAERLGQQFDGEGTVRAVEHAAHQLWDHVGAHHQKLAVLAFSFGTYYALKLSMDDPEHVGAVVLFYGTGGGDFRQAKATYQGHFAENDPYEPAENIDQLEAAIKHADRPVAFYRYPGTGHWFFEPDRVDAFNPAAASLAWDRTLAFLRQSSTE